MIYSFVIPGSSLLLLSINKFSIPRSQEVQKDPTRAKNPKGIDRISERPPPSPSISFCTLSHGKYDGNISIRLRQLFSAVSILRVDSYYSLPRAEVEIFLSQRHDSPEVRPLGQGLVGEADELLEAAPVTHAPARPGITLWGRVETRIIALQYLANAKAKAKAIARIVLHE